MLVIILKKMKLFSCSKDIYLVYKQMIIIFILIYCIFIHYSTNWKVTWYTNSLKYSQSEAPTQTAARYIPEWIIAG